MEKGIIYDKSEENVDIAGNVEGFIAVTGGISLLISIPVGIIAIIYMAWVGLLIFLSRLIISLIQLGIANIIENQRIIIKKLNKKEEK